jgi:predicted RNA-binding Zn-ribbon protein involved in translation (DUF1610 family)
MLGRYVRRPLPGETSRIRNCPACQQPIETLELCIGIQFDCPACGAIIHLSRITRKRAIVNATGKPTTEIKFVEEGKRTRRKCKQ